MNICGKCNSSMSLWCDAEVKQLKTDRANLKAENEQLNKLFERWKHMIDPDTDPGGCANCFHQEWLEAKGE